MVKKTLPTSEMTSGSDDFEAIYESHAPSIYRFMFWRTKDETLAEDLTSNVFEKAWRTRKSFTGGSAKAWLFRIARTTLIDHWRKNKELPDDGSIISEAVSDELDLGESLDRKLAAARLQKAVARLPKDMRSVVQLRFIEGLSVREVARMLELSEANVRVIQYRALQKLRKYLQ
jgi:RNA polymerase sigma-70 factor, ECF subfamily